MTLFKDVGRKTASLFKNAVALDFDFVPKLIPYREAETQYIATFIAPLMQGRNGRNALIFGAPASVATHILNQFTHVGVLC